MFAICMGWLLGWAGVLGCFCKLFFELFEAGARQFQLRYQVGGWDE